MNNAINPYQSPIAGAVDLEPQELYEPKIFSFSGRIGRLRYFAYSGIYSLVFYFFMFIAMMAFGGYAGSGMEGAGVAMLSLVGVLYIAFFVGFAALIRRRLHDLGKTAWMGLLMLVPLLNFFFALYILFAKGDSESNDYGPKPIKNHGGLWVIALGPLFLVGVLAAVALPAYQGSVQRAAEMAE